VARIRRRRRWATQLVWLVPLLAAAVAGYLVYVRWQEQGPTITVMFRDAAGVKVRQTEVRYRGVPIGEVTALDLSPDRNFVVVSARLRQEAADLARDGSVFWIVRPEVGFERVRGLTTVITGPYIEVFPGTGRRKTDFVGVDKPSPALGRRGLRVGLVAAQIGSIRPGTAVTYRGVEVGTVIGTGLGRDAVDADVQVLFEPRFARLVRVGSRFWTTGGIDVNASLFKGVEINIESLRSLVAGGIAFATPEGTETLAREGTTFVLHDKPDPAWLRWAPKIGIPPGDGP
jgi:paraquat-inducible protein B